MVPVAGHLLAGRSLTTSEPTCAPSACRQFGTPTQERSPAQNHQHGSADLDGELLIRIEVGRSVVRVLSSPEDGG